MDAESHVFAETILLKLTNLYRKPKDDVAKMVLLSQEGHIE